MSIAYESSRLLEEVAEFLATRPSREELLGFQPSSAAVLRAEILLERSSAGTLTSEEDEELSQFEQAELLMRLIKARIRQADHV